MWVEVEGVRWVEGVEWGEGEGGRTMESGGAGVTHTHAGGGVMIPLPACGALDRTLAPPPGFSAGGADVRGAWVLFYISP